MRCFSAFLFLFFRGGEEERGGPSILYKAARERATAHQTGLRLIARWCLPELASSVSCCRLSVREIQRILPSEPSRREGKRKCSSVHGESTFTCEQISRRITFLPIVLRCSGSVERRSLSVRSTRRVPSNSLARYNRVSTETRSSLLVLCPPLRCSRCPRRRLRHRLSNQMASSLPFPPNNLNWSCRSSGAGRTPIVTAGVAKPLPRCLGWDTGRGFLCLGDRYVSKGAINCGTCTRG